MSKKKEQKESVEKNKKITFSSFYQKNYKTLMLIPILLLLFGVYFMFDTVKNDGTPIYRDISLKGGLSAIIKIDTPKTSKDLKEDLNSKFSKNSFSVSEIYEKGKKTGFIIDTDLKEKEFKVYLEKYFNIKFTFGKNYNSNFISPTLSSSFFIQTIYILLVSFLLMSIVIFAYFREFVPSSAVVISALFDIIVTIGFLDLFKFKISIAGIGALLMLIGYSIDTDILLTNRLIKEYGENYFEKTFVAFKTGSLMTITTLFAGVSALVITNSEIIFEIGLILVVGLLVDFVSTWIQNTGILLWWLEIKER